MKLVIVNGSPKKKLGNTSKLLDGFIAGYKNNKGNTYAFYSVRDLNNKKEITDVIDDADYILLAFPLYTSAMPGPVKRFIERLAYLRHNPIESNPKLLYMVQSGMPEALHSRHIEKFLEKLSKRLSCPHIGTIIKGGLESIFQTLPPFIGKWIVKYFQNQTIKIGCKFSDTGTLDFTLLKKMAFPEKLPWFAILFFNIYDFIGIRYFGFDRVLKDNNMWDNRDAAPYA